METKNQFRMEPFWLLLGDGGCINTGVISVVMALPDTEGDPAIEVYRKLGYKTLIFTTENDKNPYPSIRPVEEITLALLRGYDSVSNL